MSSNKKRGQIPFFDFHLARKNGSDPFFQNALREDIGPGDVTSRLLIPKDKEVNAVLLLKEKAVVCGLDIARQVFSAADGSVKFQARAKDGDLEKQGKIIADIRGNARSILKAERTALNILSHLSGVASITRAFVDMVRPYKTKIMDTRKSLPGLRLLQKYAVRTGGGYNHRMGLWDGILIKDNHIAVSCVGGHGSGVGGRASWAMRHGSGVWGHASGGMRREAWVKRLVEMAKAKAPKGLKVEVEVINLEEFQTALELRPDIIMLDNMKIEDIQKAVAIRRKTQYSQRMTQDPRLTTLIEASGGVNLDNVRDIARTGVDMISIGSLTHSAKAVDISLEVIAKGG